MKIEAIYVACYKYDLRYTRILIASIRQWYPDIPILLIKDRLYGDFSTTEIEHHWNASLLKTEGGPFGWGFSKLEPLFLPERQRCLILDSDIVFAGPVLPMVEACDSDVVVQHEDPAPAFVESHYFHLPSLQQLDPDFHFPGFTFNTGQIVATTGVLRREDFAPFVKPGYPITVIRPDIFKLGEQGLLNYVLMKKAQCGELSLSRARFMEVPESPDGHAFGVQLDRLNENSSYRFLIHWCGLKKHRIREMNRGDILLHFERLYYDAITFGTLRKWSRIARTDTEDLLRVLARKAALRNWWKTPRKENAS